MIAAALRTIGSAAVQFRRVTISRRLCPRCCVYSGDCAEFISPGADRCSSAACCFATLNGVRFWRSPQRSFPACRAWCSRQRANLGRIPGGARALRRVAPIRRFGEVWVPRGGPRDWRPYDHRPLGLYRRLGLVLDLRRGRRGLGLDRLPLRPLGVRARLGWFWIPGDEWAPAWVDLARRRRCHRLGAAAAG